MQAIDDLHFISDNRFSKFNFLDKKFDQKE